MKLPSRCLNCATNIVTNMSTIDVKMEKCYKLVMAMSLHSRYFLLWKRDDIDGDWFVDRASTNYEVAP